MLRLLGTRFKARNCAVNLVPRNWCLLNWFLWWVFLQHDIVFFLSFLVYLAWNTLNVNVCEVLFLITIILPILCCGDLLPWRLRWREGAVRPHHSTWHHRREGAVRPHHGTWHHRSAVKGRSREAPPRHLYTLNKLFLKCRCYFNKYWFLANFVLENQLIQISFRFVLFIILYKWKFDTGE
jgi:hypothetical protein